MSLFQIKIISFWRRAKNTCLSLLRLKKKKNLNNQMEMDKILVQSLSPKKIPDGKQLRHLRKFLNKKELLIIRVLFFVFLISSVFVLYSFLNKKIVYTPAKGGNYIEALVGYPKNINPLYASSREVDSDISSLIYSSLFQYNEGGVLENDLVDIFEIKNEGREYLIKIKENVHWHDGSDLTTDDIVFTFNLIKDENYRSPLRNSLVGVEVEKIDNVFVKFTLTEAYSPFPTLLTFGILPKSLWENNSPDSISLSDLNLKAVGSGPFKFKSIVKTKGGDIKEYVLESNNDYYKQGAYLKTIKFIFYPTKQEAVKALNDKQVLGLSGLSYNEQSELLAKNSLQIRSLIEPQNINLFFNENNNEFLKDKKIRLALSKAINKEELVTEIFNNIYRPINSLFLAETLLKKDKNFVSNYSPKESIEFVGDKEISLSLTVVDVGSNLAVAEKIKSYWESVGVKTEIKIINGEQITDVIKNRDFQVLLYGQDVGGDPDVYAFWHSSQIGSGLNLAGYNNEELDQLLIKARTESDYQLRVEDYKKIEELINNEVAVIFLYAPAYLYVQSNDVRGFSTSVIVNPSDRFNNVENWHIKTNKKISW